MHIIDFLIQKGADVNQVGNDGNSALIWASVAGDLIRSVTPYTELPESTII